MQPGIVHQHVKPSIRLHDRGNRCFPSLRVGHIQIQQTAALWKLRRQGLRILAIRPHAEPHPAIAIVCQKIPADPPPESAVSASDQDASHVTSVAVRPPARQGLDRRVGTPPVNDHLR